MNKMHYPLKTNHIPPSPAAPQAPPCYPDLANATRRHHEKEIEWLRRPAKNSPPGRPGSVFNWNRPPAISWLMPLCPCAPINCFRSITSPAIRRLDVFPQPHPTHSTPHPRPPIRTQHPRSQPFPTSHPAQNKPHSHPHPARLFPPAAILEPAWTTPRSRPSEHQINART
jgi:hypothetical protein